MDNRHLPWLQLQIACEVLLEETQCLDALGENDDSVGGVSGIPVQIAAWLQHLHQALILGEIAGSNAFQGFCDAAQGDAILLGIRAGFLFDLRRRWRTVSRQAAGEEKRDFSSTVLKSSWPVRRV